MIKINKKAPEFEEKAFIDGKVEKISLDDYKGKWLILFFYPADFSYVCPTELQELANKYGEIKGMDTEVIGISTDTIYVHKAWHNNSKAINNIKFPLLADPAMRVSKAYETLINDKGIAQRASFIIGPEGKIRAYEFHDNDLGRNIDELIRKIQALKHIDESEGELCPVNWQPGQETIKEV